MATKKPVEELEVVQLLKKNPKITDLEAQIATIQGQVLDLGEITTDEGLTAAATITDSVKNYIKKIDATRKFFTEPRNKEVKALNEFFKQFSKPLNEVKEMADDAVNAYLDKKDLEAVQAAQELEANIGSPDDADDALAMLDFATPAVPKGVVTTTGQAVTFRDNFKYRILDIAKVPDEYTKRVVDEDAIQRAIKDGMRENQIPGIEIYNDRTQVKGR